MRNMDLTASTTPCCTSAPRTERLIGWRAWLVGICLLFCTALPAWAQGSQVKEDVPPVTLERTAEGLMLSARLPLQLPSGLEDALRKGVPLHFVWQVELVRARWYWWDQKLFSATRSVRLLYQPLTRRWRVSTVTGEFGSGGLNALHQNVDTLQDALASAFRVSGWQVADSGQWDAKPQDRLRLRVQLDQNLLPKPFQIGLGSNGDNALNYETLLSLANIKNKSDADD